MNSIEIQSFHAKCKGNSDYIKDCFDLTIEKCLISVSIQPLSIKHVPLNKLTQEIQTTAVSGNYVAIRYIDSSVLTDLTKFLAIKINGRALRWIDEQTEEICLAAIKRKSGFAIQYVKDQTLEICKEALRQNVHALMHIKDQTEYLIKFALDLDGTSLQHVKDQTLEHCKIAMADITDVKEIGKISKYIQNGCIEILFNVVHIMGYNYIKDNIQNFLNNNTINDFKKYKDIPECKDILKEFVINRINCNS